MMSVVVVLVVVPNIIRLRVVLELVLDYDHVGVLVNILWILRMWMYDTLVLVLE